MFGQGLHFLYPRFGLAAELPSILHLRCVIIVVSCLFIGTLVGVS